MDEELRFAGLMVAPEVVETIVKLAAEKVEGVASVGVPSDLGAMFSLFSPKKPAAAVPGVAVAVEGDALRIAVHLAVFFGYPFVTLADEVRERVAANVASQVGAEIAGVDVYIDALVFPKE